MSMLQSLKVARARRGGVSAETVVTVCLTVVVAIVGVREAGRFLRPRDPSVNSRVESHQTSTGGSTLGQAGQQVISFVDRDLFSSDREDESNSPKHRLRRGFGQSLQKRL